MYIEYEIPKNNSIKIVGFNINEYIIEDKLATFKSSNNKNIITFQEDKISVKYNNSIYNLESFILNTNNGKGYVIFKSSFNELKKIFKRK